MNLRPYQQDAVREIYAALSHPGSSTLLVIPTGTGKTVVFSTVVGGCVQKGKRALVLAHREELIYQAVDKIQRVTGHRAAIEMAEWRADAHQFFGSRAPVVVSSIQTQATGRMERFNPSDFGLLVVDEAHHATAPSYRRVIDYYRQNEALRVLGVTATPDRADEAALGQVFDTVAFEYGVSDAIDDGWLVPVRQQFVRVEGLDFSRVRTTAGDLNGSELAALMEYEHNLHAIADPTMKLAGDRPTLVFAASVAHADRLAEIFDRHRPGSARVVTGATPKDERAAMLREFKARRFQYLCNVGVATEGFDEPQIGVVVMARPTKSRALYAQMLGRGTRPLEGVVDGPATAEERRAAIAASGKPFMTVLDFVGNSGRHKLVHAADILGGKFSDDLVAKAERAMQDGDGEQDVLEKLREAELEEVRRADAEARRQRRNLVIQTSFSVDEVSPFDVLGIKPKREPGWHKGRRPSPAMVAAMERRGIRGSERMSWWEVKQILATATPKQAKVLQRAGWWEPGLSFEEASRRMDVLSKNNWTRPLEAAS